jgi:hypothetical protein
VFYGSGGTFPVGSIPIARSTSSHRWPMTANGAPFAAARNRWPTFAGAGCGFTRSLVRMTGFDRCCRPRMSAADAFISRLAHLVAGGAASASQCHKRLGFQTPSTC